MYKTVHEAITAQELKPVEGPEILYCDNRKCEECPPEVQKRCKVAVVSRRHSIGT